MEILHHVFLALLALVFVSEGYKILVVFPFPARSHNNLGNGVVRHLLQAGHEITYITPFPLKNPDPKLHQIDVNATRAAFPDTNVNIHALMHKEVDLNNEVFQYFAVEKVVKTTIENEDVQKLMNAGDQHFDVAIVEWMFIEVYAGFAAVFNCPYIWAFPYEPHPNIMYLIDEQTNPAYVPNFITNNVPPFTFLQRAQELWNQILSMSLKSFYFNIYERELYDTVFGPVLARKGRPLPPYNEIRFNASLVLGNSHPSIGQSIRLPQSYKIISGYYIDEQPPPLPEDLKNLMESNKHGVIYFSMGSNLKSKELAPEIKMSLLKMFGRLKQTVLWKFEEDFPGLPRNVHIMRWTPQQSILSHPNCVLFITHGGLLSTTETVYHAKPFIGIPVFGDQFNNVDRAVNRGFAKRVDISYSVADDLEIAIKEILDDPRYTEKARELSSIFHDRPISPGAEMVHWVEHVVRTGGAAYLRSPALHVAWYQKIYLDLAAFVLAIILLFRLASNRMFSFGTRKRHSKAEKKKD